MMRPHTGPVCPVHGEMDPTWTRCPQCIREGRDGRLVLPGAAGAVVQGEPPAPPAPRPSEARWPSPPPQPEPYGAEPPRPSTPAPGLPPSYAQAAPPAPPPAPQPAIRETMPPPEPAPAPPVRATLPPQPAAPPPAPPGPDRPVSSVGGTVVIRRRPRALAYLIEKEGEQVGRVFQLEQDVTDIGRDPRNHVVVSDVLVSGWHARVERAPDGGYLISDRGSTNGSRLNGEPLDQSRPFHENDEFGLGSTTLVFKVVQ